MTAQQQAEEGLRRALAQANGDALAILDHLADRYSCARPTSPMTAGSREARIGAVAVELFGWGPRGDAAERRALALAPPVTEPITRGEYALRLRAAIREAS